MLGLGLRRRLRLLSIRSRAALRERQRAVVLGRYARRERPLLESARAAAMPPSADPLVTVTIATWNRAPILATRTIPALLRQTHANFEAIIVGDCCSDDSAAVVASFGDPRLRFINLPERGRYPDDPFKRHCVAGSVPMMHARSLSGGEWIAHLDDDEEWVPEHLELLLRRAMQTDAELVWGRARYETAPGEWLTQGNADMQAWDIPHSTVMMRSYLRLFQESMTSWRLALGADHHRFRRMALCGVRTAFVDEVITIGALRPGTTANWSKAEDIQ